MKAFAASLGNVSGQILIWGASYSGSTKQIQV